MHRIGSLGPRGQSIHQVSFIGQNNESNDYHCITIIVAINPDETDTMRCMWATTDDDCGDVCTQSKTNLHLDAKVRLSRGTA